MKIATRLPTLIFALLLIYKVQDADGQSSGNGTVPTVSGNGTVPTVSGNGTTPTISGNGTHPPTISSNGTTPTISGNGTHPPTISSNGTTPTISGNGTTPSTTPTCSNGNRDPSGITDFLYGQTCTCPVIDQLAQDINCNRSILEQCELSLNLVGGLRGQVCEDVQTDFGNMVLPCLNNPCTSDCACTQAALDFLQASSTMTAAPVIASFFECLDNNGCTDLTGIPGGETNVRALLASPTCQAQKDFFESAFNADLTGCTLNCPVVPTQGPTGVSSSGERTACQIGSYALATALFLNGH